jgi:N6-adenosine-specific RNA methylase IME4
MSKFQIIVADPAWAFSDRLTMSDVPRGAQSNYKTMSITDIKNMPVKELADPNGALLALWVPSSLLKEGLDVMTAWGFSHKQTYIWVKSKKEPFKTIISNVISEITNNVTSFGSMKRLWKKVISHRLADSSMNDMLFFGMGRLFRQCHEICLIGTNNNKIYKKLQNKSQRSVSFGENLKHSAKPEHLQNSLELMFPDSSKIELFARRVRPNWTCLGDEVCDGEDIYDSIKRVQGLL